MRTSSPRPRHEHTDHTRPWKTLREVFAPKMARRATTEPAGPQGSPQDIDATSYEVAAMWASGIPFKLIPGLRFTSDGEGHPIPGGGAAEPDHHPTHLPVTPARSTTWT